MNLRYTLYGKGGDIHGTGTNKLLLIKKARSMKTPATVVDEFIGGIIFENKAQKFVNRVSSI